MSKIFTRLPKKEAKICNSREVNFNREQTESITNNGKRISTILWTTTTANATATKAGRWTSSILFVRSEETVYDTNNNFAVDADVRVIVFEASTCLKVVMNVDVYFVFCSSIYSEMKEKKKKKKKRKWLFDIKSKKKIVKL